MTRSIVTGRRAAVKCSCPPLSEACEPPFPSVLVAPRRGKPATAGQLRVWRCLQDLASGERVDVGARELAREANVSPMTAH